MLLITPLVLCIGVGAVLLVLGFRGRRVNDHPSCRKCRFDLAGLPVEAERCPECGADLSKPRATRRGVRKRMRSLSILGLVLLLLPAIGVGALVTASATGFNLNTIKPARLLAYEAVGRDDSVAGAALKELKSRLIAKSLSEGQIHFVIDRGLAYQADESRPWRIELGNFIEYVWLAGNLDDARKRRYARHAVIFLLEARPRVRQGDSPPLQLRAKWRLGDSGVLQFDAAPFGARLGEEPARLSVANVQGMARSTTRWPVPFDRDLVVPLCGDQSSWSTKPWKVPSDLQTGSYSFDTRWSVVMHEPVAESLAGGSSGTSWTHSTNQENREWDDDPNWASMSVPGEAAIRSPFGFGLPPEILNRKDLPNELKARLKENNALQRFAEYRVELSAPVEIVPSSERVVALIQDQAIGEEIRSALKVTGWLIEGRPSGMIAAQHPTTLPVDLAFDVFWRLSDGRETRIGPAIVRARDSAKTSAWARGRYYRPENWQRTIAIPTPSVDIVLRTSPDAARATLDIDRIWDGELVFPNVPVDSVSTQSGPVTEIARFKADFPTHVFRSVALGSKHAYVLDRNGRLFVYVLNPLDLAGTPTFTIDNAGDGQDLAVHESFLYCTADGGFNAYRLDDPAHPVCVAEVRPSERTWFFSGQILIEGDRAIVTGHDAFAVYDISDPGNPARLAYNVALDTRAGGCVVGDFLYLSAFHDDRRQLVCYDIAGPTKPVEVSRIELPAYAPHIFAPAPDRLIVCLDAKERTSDGQGVHGRAVLVDIADPARPRIITTALGCGGRSATLFDAEPDPLLVCNGGVFAVKRDSIVPLHTGRTVGSNLDGAGYGGDATREYAAITTDDVVMVYTKTKVDQ